MSQETATSFVDNPYSYLRAAQEYTRVGDMNGAAIAYKASIMAADHLPLADYRSDYQTEVNKYRSTPGYQTEPGVSLQDLSDTYADLLSLPFRARVLFANFLLQNDALSEARSVSDSAFETGIDAVVLGDPVCVELMAKANELRQLINERLQIAAKPKPKESAGLSSVLVKNRNTAKAGNQTPAPQDVKSSGSHEISAMDEMWQHHMNTKKKAEESSMLSSGNDEDPLSCDMKTMVDSMFSCLHAFTQTLGVMQRYRGQNIVVTEPGFVEESLRRATIPGQYAVDKVQFYRFRASTILSSLSVRATESTIEIFIVPASEVMRLSDIEHDSCLRGTFKLRQVTEKTCWTSDGMPVYADDVRVGLRNVLKELVQGSADFVKMDVDARTSIVGGGGLLKRISELSQQRTNLAEKIVYQQEQIQNRIARDLHDGVIGDLLAMKRSIEAEYPGEDRYVQWLEKVVDQMRGICADISPRDLMDWGLLTVVKDLVSAVAVRTGMRGEVHVDESLPALPQEVQLHIYRIIQECLINTEKHSKATRIEARIEMREHILFISVEDNGIGFNPAAPDTRTAKTGGMGLDSMKERVQLIRCFYPAQIWINSVEGGGTRTIIQINSSGG